jgi:predicted DCC family thiol-disulfide oxidoreductase YuxK
VSEPALILFDGVCNLCNGAVNFVIRRDPAGRFRFAPLQEPGGQRLLAAHHLRREDFDSLVLLEEGRSFLKSTAALRIARHLGALWPLLYFFIIVPRPLRDSVYDWVARNRYRWFGRRDACMVPAPDVLDRFLR